MFERLKKWFRGRTPEVEYRPGPAEEPFTVPSGPPISGIPPAAPVERPADDESERQS
jgi:hypothetical protein